VVADSKRVWGPASLTAGFRHTERSSTAASSTAGVEAIEEDKNYRNSRFWTGISYPF